MFELMYACGMRVSEISSLRIRDIDFIEQIVRITGKGDKQRIVPFYDTAKQLLKSYLHTVRGLWCDGSHDYVFVNQRGKQMTSRGIQYRLDIAGKKRICKCIFIPICFVIVLQHTCWIMGQT